MKCGTCKIREEINKKRNICASCYAKDYRKNNKNKVKAYAKMRQERDKDKIKAYREKTRERSILYNRKYKEANPEVKRKYEYTEKRKLEHAIRSRTREKYPLKNNSCIECGYKAEHRHHTTNPIEIDKFIFLCRKCHDKVHGIKRFALQNKSEVKGE